MLSFITFKDAPEQVEIVADEQGIEDLIEYLKFVKRSKDHFHLTVGSEIDIYPIGDLRTNKTLCAKHVRLEFSEKNNWDIKKG